MNRVRFLISAFCVAQVATIAAAGNVSPQAPDPNAQVSPVVATIGDCAITKDELTQRLLQEVRPHEQEFYQEPEPVVVETVLRKMLAEKATSMEGRKLGYLQEDPLHGIVTQFEQQKIVSMLLETQLGDKVTVADSDIDQVMKANPKLTRERAKAFAQRAKAMRVMEQYYGELAAKRKLTKVTENLSKAAEIHQRLLTQPKTPRSPGEYWIRNSQMSTDLSDEEKNLVLATFDGGQFTLKDWFQTLCNLAPPKRPKDLDKAEGVEKLLNMAVRAPVLAAEARSLGYDKDPKVQSDLKAFEDQRLLYKTQEVETQSVKEPTADEVKEYFDKNVEKFATSPVLKVDQIWCPDEETARKVRGLLDQGGDFLALHKDYSLQKDVPTYSLSPMSEGIFWADVWKGEPNQVLGPVMGFYNSGVKWRVAKVLEKTPAKTQAFTEQLGNSVKWALFAERRQQVLNDFEKKLLEKYPYEIFSDRIQDLNPLEIALKQQDK
ncbi:MAG: peptidyl-prolyl cis-trans isomerase [Solirubrobacterales bacterium]